MKPKAKIVISNGRYTVQFSIADCDSFEEDETIANGNAMNGSVNIERY